MRRQLALVSAATTALVLIAFLVPIWVLLGAQAEQRAISAATLDAHSRVATAAADPQAAATTGYSSGASISVFTPDGTVYGAAAARTPSVELASLGRAFTARSGSGVEILVPVGRPEGTVVIRAYLSAGQMREGIASTRLMIILIGLSLFAVGLMLADRLGRHLVSAARSLGDTADRLAKGDLQARVIPDGPPELRRSAAELNHLAARITELLATQRQEAADIAHRLRTPLTALRLDIGMLTDEPGRNRVAEDVDALERMVDEVIRAARRPVREGAIAQSDLTAIAADRVTYWSALAEDTGRPLGRRLPQGVLPVRVTPEDLTAAIDALLENAFTHTPETAEVCVTVSALPDGAGLLIVDDAGPGLQPEAMDARHQRVGSTGLGLDIVGRTAAASGGRMVVGPSRLGGTSVRVVFGPPS